MSMKGIPSPEAEWLEADGLGNRDADWIAPKTWPRQAYSNGKFPRDLRSGFFPRRKRTLMAMMLKLL